MPGFADPPPRRAHRAALVTSIGLLAFGAWVALWVMGDQLHGPIHEHSHQMHMTAPGLVIVFFVGAWTVMTVAMMLPTSLPIIAVFQTIAGRRADKWLLLALVVFGYLAVWSVFGFPVYFGNLLFRRIVAASPWLTQQSWAAGPLLLLFAGLFQFTRLKYRCLDKCRSPLSFVIQHWQGRQDRWQAFRLGVDHGLFCVGCCWALMLLMFVAGFGSIGWMMVLAAVMAVEKNVSWGRRASAPLGFILVTAGAALLLFRPSAP
jgi:predicted metal-binding membrane protein